MNCVSSYRLTQEMKDMEASFIFSELFLRYKHGDNETDDGDDEKPADHSCPLIFQVLQDSSKLL